ncbi:hypothetical protein L9F63_016041 [Diploptera punctata]|uniref:Uncharacterized protein n=1 Tax=Diploptera punctata TaxID=6984 RepID=A0AAD8A214_DIPPU|nr:hypothetical protein L9F63_016041 [Diploptera punctata]
MPTYIVDLLPTSKITVQPGERVSLIFNVTSLQSATDSITFLCQTSQQQYFQQLIVRPLSSNILPGKSIQVEVTTALYSNVPQGTQIVVEFIVQSYWGSQPATSRAAYLYVGTYSNSDTDSPAFRYSVKSNCKHLSSDSCSQATWNMEGSIQDSNSGLISVTSSPTGLQFQGSFIAGTKSPVPVYYSASCCLPKIDITATDAKSNSRVFQVNVNSDNEQLTDAEITAIVLGVLLILVLIILIILACLLCRKWRSHDLRH